MENKYLIAKVQKWKFFGKQSFHSRKAEMQKNCNFLNIIPNKEFSNENFQVSDKRKKNSLCTSIVKECSFLVEEHVVFGDEDILLCRHIYLNDFKHF